MATISRVALSAAVGMALLSSSYAAEISKGSARTDIVTGPADVAGLVATLATSALLLLAALFILYTLVLPLLQARSFSTFAARSNSEDMGGVLGRVLNSIDPVESAFEFMNVTENVCRRRTVCELQSAASKYPIVGALIRYMSPSIRGLDNYREAQEAGSALEDCAILFAECPYSMLQ